MTMLALILIGFTSSLFANDVHLAYGKYMETLIEHAKKHSPEYPFAAMLINSQTGKELCRGVNRSHVNPTQHAVVEAINECTKKYGSSIDWSALTLVATAEPCPMCQGAIIWSKIPLVVYGTSIKTLVNKGWDQIDIDSRILAHRSNFNQPQIVGNVHAHETDPLFRDYNKKKKG